MLIFGGSTSAMSEEGGTGGGVRTKDLAEKIVALCETCGRYSAMLADLQRTGESQISLTGPDSRAMAAHTKVGACRRREA